MNFSNESLTLFLYLAAGGQAFIAILSLFLGRLLDWKADIAKMPLLIREVFLIHGYFISITVMLFAVLTFRFAGELAVGANELGRWLAAGIGIFWGVRSIMQWTHYSSAHWRGIPSRTVIHFIVFFGYALFAGAYFLVAFK